MPQPLFHLNSFHSNFVGLFLSDGMDESTARKNNAGMKKFKKMLFEFKTQMYDISIVSGDVHITYIQNHVNAHLPVHAIYQLLAKPLMHSPRTSESITEMVTSGIAYKSRSTTSFIIKVLMVIQYITNFNKTTYFVIKRKYCESYGLLTDKFSTHYVGRASLFSLAEWAIIIGVLVVLLVRLVLSFKNMVTRNITIQLH